MTSTARGRKQALREAVSRGELRALQILQAALMSGVLLFAMVVVLLATATRTGATGEPLPAATLRTLCWVHAAMALFAWGFAPLLQSLMLRQSTSTENILTGLRQATLLRLALLEAPAILGLVICLLAHQGDVLQTQPLYWLNALSAAAFLIYGALSFPTESRLEERVLGS